MTAEQQRIAIAEACGWTYTKTVKELPYGRAPEGKHPTMFGKEVSWDIPLPNYLNDLNAMREAEHLLFSRKKPLWDSFAMHLCNIGYRGTTTIKYAIHATAAQRAEAFLRTLNLWKD